MEKEDLKTALKKINFATRYKNLSDKYKEEKGINTPIKDVILKIFNDLGYSAKFYRSENFYQVVHYFEDFEFMFNIGFKYGSCEFIWYLSKKDKYIGGGGWGAIARSITDNNTRYPLPCFSNYDTLELILKQVFSLFEDFKKEVITQQYGKKN